MLIEVDAGAVRALAPRLTGLGHDVDAVCAAVVPQVGAACGAVGDGGLAAAVADLADALNGGLQGAVLSLLALGDAVSGAAAGYLAQDGAVARGMRPQP